MRPYPIGEVVKDAQSRALLGAIVELRGNNTAYINRKDGKEFFWKMKDLRVATRREAKGGV